MYTVETALESLKKYDVTSSDLATWEKALKLELPVDEFGHKQYSPHHINLFKNIKKHLALGRTIDEIARIVTLPPIAHSQPQAQKPLLPEKNIPSPSIQLQPESRQTSSSRVKLSSHQQPQSQSIVQPQRELVGVGAAQSGSINAVGDTAGAHGSVGHSLGSTATIASPVARQNGPLPPVDRSVEINQGVSAIRTAPTPSSLSPETAPNSPGQQGSVPDKSPYASVPKRATMTPQRPSQKDGGASNVVHLVHQLTQEKDKLYKKLMETEKLNSHLYSANSLFHKKANEMSRQINQLKEDRNENERFKLLDDKSRLHKQLLDAERATQQKQSEILNQEREIHGLRQEMDQLNRKIQTLNAGFDPEKFRGDWIETGRLVDIAYDNFGINIESERVRMFRISELPKRRYGGMAVIHTAYQYESNTLWKREETLIVSYHDEDILEGELIAEYILDGVPVAKAVYRVHCRRK